jgi:diguanylate cyclase (GGDEF)-like protein/PAS domain S-box-containing protein
VSKSIFIVENDALTATQIENYIKKIGYHLSGVSDNAEAVLLKIKKSKPDLILMDIRLNGDIDGIEVAARLKAENDVAVVYLTAYVDDDLLARAKLTEPFGYLVKPFNLQDLKASIEIAIYKNEVARRISHHCIDKKVQLTANAFTHIREGMMITSADGYILDINETFSRITGYECDDVIGKSAALLCSNHHDKPFYASLLLSLIEMGHWYGEIWGRHKNADIIPVMLTISAVRDTTGNIMQYVALFSDISKRLAHEHALEQIAYYDALTGLPNRVLLMDRLELAMAQAKRRSTGLVLGFLDLDHFKEINDHYGHQAGDYLLLTVGHRMQKMLRSGDTLARLGGDEFVILLVDLTEISACFSILTRLIAAVAEPILFGDASLQVTANLGVTFHPKTQDLVAGKLLDQADQAMYQAKKTSMNRYHIFNAIQDSEQR